MSRFERQKICVVGGSVGMGLAIARRAAKEGAEVILTSRSEETARKVVAEIGNNSVGKALDVTNEASVAAFFKSLGAIDHLVITAASVIAGPFRTKDLENARFSFEGKFWSQYYCAQQAEVSRSILFFSGALSRRPQLGTTIISAVNGAIEALGRALAVELAPVRVNVLSPGLVKDTAAYVGMPDAAREVMMANAATRLPARLVGGPESVAALALAVLESDYITGTVVDVDGGGLLV